LYIENAKKNPTPKAVVTIPVVFHVVYKNASENVSDACLLAQLQVLNDDYRKLNSDAALVTQPGFAALAADCEVQFCLAVRDPGYNITTGITRTATSVSSFGDDKIKYTAQGGEDVWDRNRFLNIWIGDLTNPYLGFSQFPGNAAATDGVVIDYKYMVGAAGCGTAPYAHGRTLTHELGHWFGLRHIWGDDGAACTGTDLAADTPNQADEHYGCYTPGSVDLDACTSTSPGTMWMNFMDYTNDLCMYMFTLGQKTLLDATMNGLRSSLKTSDGCTPLSVAERLLSSQSLSIYPNPSAGNFALTLNVPNISSADLIIYNALGDIVLEKKIRIDAGDDIEVNMGEAPNGIYLAKMKTAEGAITKKVVINR